jgi:hypothetical protein
VNYCFLGGSCPATAGSEGLRGTRLCTASSTQTIRVRDGRLSSPASSTFSSAARPAVDRIAELEESPATRLATALARLGRAFLPRLSSTVPLQPCAICETPHPGSPQASFTSYTLVSSMSTRNRDLSVSSTAKPISNKHLFIGQPASPRVLLPERLRLESYCESRQLRSRLIDHDLLSRARVAALSLHHNFSRKFSMATIVSVYLHSFMTYTTYNDRIAVAGELGPS